MNPDDIKINLKRSYPVPHGFADRVMTRIEQESVRKNALRDWLADLWDLKWEVAAAAFASVFVLVYSLAPRAAEPRVVLLAQNGMTRDEVARSIFDDEESLLKEVSDE